MSPTSRTTFTKRQKEHARLQKARDKAERRTQKKLEQGSAPDADSLIDAEAAANQLLTPEEILNSRKGE